MLPAANFLPQLRGLLLFVEVVIADERFLNSEVVQKFEGLPRVFTRDEIGVAKRIQSARADIGKVSDRRGDDDKRAHAVDGRLQLELLQVASELVAQTPVVSTQTRRWLSGSQACRRRHSVCLRSCRRKPVVAPAVAGCRR